VNNKKIVNSLRDKLCIVKSGLCGVFDCEKYIAALPPGCPSFSKTDTNCDDVIEVIFSWCRK
jgi:hypothetical protein